MTTDITVKSETQIIVVEPSFGAISVINAGPAGPTVIPPGGTTGQHLKKLSNADYDVGWGT